MPIWKKGRELFRGKIQLHHLFSLILIFVCSVVLAHVIFRLSPAQPEEKLFFQQSIEQYPSLFWLNYLPILLLMLFCYFLTNHTLVSILVSGGVFGMLGIANRMKIQMRQDPLLPSDLSLVREVMAILKGFDATTLKKIVMLLVCLVVMLVIAGIFFRNHKMPWQVRVGGLAAVIVGGFCMNTAWYAKDSIYDMYPVMGNIYFQVNQYQSKGFVYCFLHSFNTMQVEKPEQYTPSVYIAAEHAPEVDEQTLPNIIMIMGEAYSDLSLNPHLDFSNYIDPMENYKELIGREETIAGHIVVPNFGGGTSDTEYDVLTACPTRYLDNALPSYNFVRTEFDALPRRLSAIGYDTLAIHPGYLWFYNRYNVYQYFGFDTFLNLENFDAKTQSKGGYISEEATIDSIIDTLDQHMAESDKPLFSFTVTIQNHGPYQDKYNETKKNFDTDIALTKEEENMLYNYFNGLKDVDRELGRLVDYLETVEEPVVLVYFGDHLPGFSNGMDFFDILEYDIDIDGTPEQRLGVYETPYFIWQNEAAEETTAIAEHRENLQLPEGNLISSNYLGAMLVEALGLEGLSPLYDYANALRKEVPVMANQCFLQGDGTYTEEISQELMEDILYLAGWQYYKLFDEKT